MSTQKNFTLEQAFQEMDRTMTLRNYSGATKKSYVGCLRRYLKAHQQQINDPDKTSIENFLLTLFDSGSSAQTVQSYLHAIQFFYREVIESGVDLHIQTPKRPQRLPVTLSRDEIERALVSADIKKPATFHSLRHIDLTLCNSTPSSMKRAICWLFGQKNPQCSYGYICGFSALQSFASHPVSRMLSPVS